MRRRQGGAISSRSWGCNLGAWSASGLFYKFVIRLPLLKHVNPYAEVRPCGICCVPLRFRKFWHVPPCIVLSCLDSRHIYLDHLRCIDRVGESCWACVCISCDWLLLPRHWIIGHVWIKNAGMVLIHDPLRNFQFAVKSLVRVRCVHRMQ